MATTSRHGRLQELDVESETVTAYLERVELYFDANDVADDKKVPVLLSNIGAKTYGLLRSLAAPKAPKEKTLEEIKTLLTGHYEPTPSVIAERYRFHRRDQVSGESIAAYVAELRKLTTHCKFEETKNFLEDSLRDRFVCGLRSESARKRLFQEDKLTLIKAIELAQNLETASKDAQMKGPEHAPTGSNPVHKVVSPPQKEACYRCGLTNHKANDCRLKEATCHGCGKKGHIKRACKSSRQPRRRGRKTPTPRGKEVTKWVNKDQSDEDSDESVEVHVVGKSLTNLIHVEVRINGKPLSMEVDTGAAVSLISYKKLKQVLPRIRIRKTTVVLRTYTSEVIPVRGEVQVNVTYGEQKKLLTLNVTKQEGPCLLGREWLTSIRLDWKMIGLATVDKVQTRLHEMLKRYSEVFQDDLGTMKEIKAELKLKENASPKFHRPRTVPFALKGAVEQELTRLEDKGILKKVSHSSWAAPIVPVPKKDGKVRVCGDYKVTVNPCLDVDQYPLPKSDDLFATLANGKTFSKLDLSQAYQQMVLDEASANCLTINTHLGLFQYTRLPFGVASAPAMFQRAMDLILQGIEGCICYIDDILVTGSTDEEHLERLEEVLKRLKEYGLRVKKNKCDFFQRKVEYLGHQVDADGLHTLPSKVDAIVHAPEPENEPQLRSFLGLLNYYSKFIPNLATMVHPLNRLLRQDVRWKWTPDCAKAFKQAKESLVSSKVLAHYDAKLPIKLAADASAYGVGAVISHVYPDGSEHPVAFASRTLTAAEQNYAQLEKEALALIYGIKHFHQYLYGRIFTLVTDHKPLTTILNPRKGIPSLAAARLQRWAIILSAYRYEIEFKRTQEHCNADGLSRLPLPNEKAHVPHAVDVFTVAQLDSLPVTAEQIGQATRVDPILSKVRRFTKSGWPHQVNECIKPYWYRRNEITIEGDCLMWGIRVIVPKKLQEDVLKELHRDHQGIARMKANARSYLWWPGVDKSLEQIARDCRACKSTKSMPAVAPLHPWVWPSRPWQRLHIDFAGPFKGRMFFVLVDAHSKWPEVIEMKSTTAERTIEVMRTLFGSYGIPEQVVSDNGPQFASEDFAEFMRRNRIKHIRSTPYHPSTNGLAERFVQTFKRALIASEQSGRTFNQRLVNFLFSCTPHATTNRTPSSLFLKRELRTRLDLLRPDDSTKVGERHANQKLGHDSRANLREYKIGDNVMARNYTSGPKWETATVMERKGPLSYVVQLNSGVIWRRHVDQLRDGVSDTSNDEDDVPVGNPRTSEPEPELPDEQENSSPEPADTNDSNDPHDDTETVDNSEPTDDVEPESAKTYPSRVRKQPQRYM